MNTIGEIVRSYISKGATEGYGFSGRHGMIFFDLKDYANDETPGHLTSKGYLYGHRPNGSKYKIGQIVHPDFGWSGEVDQKAA